MTSSATLTGPEPEAHPCIIDLHPYQRKAIFSTAPIILALAGLQSGKTFAGSIWMRLQMSSPDKDPRDTFIVTAPSYKIMSAATVPSFLEINGELGTYLKADSIFNLRDGRTVYFRSSENPYAVEGITRCKAVWADEAGLYSDMAWLGITGRASPMQAPIFISSTPYWCYGWMYHLYEAWKRGERTDVDCIQWTSADNPYFPAAEFERQKRLLDPRLFRLRYEGIFERMQGLVYPDIDGANFTDPFKVDRSKFMVVGGVDWGSASACAIAIRAITREHQGEYRDYQIAEAKVSGLDAGGQADLVRSMHKRYGVEQWVADSAEMGMVQLCCNQGMPMQGVTKGPNSVSYGIALHNELIRTKQYKMFINLCKETEREYARYSYEVPKEGKTPSENPVKYDDHLMDCNRYISSHFRYLRDHSAKERPEHKTHLQSLLDGEYAVATGLQDGLD